MIDNLSKHRLLINTKVYLNTNQYRTYIVRIFYIYRPKKIAFTKFDKKSYNEKVAFIAVVIKKKNSLRLYDDYIHVHIHTICIGTISILYTDFLHFN